MAIFDFNQFVLIQGTMTVDPASFTSILNSPRSLTNPFTFIVNKALNSAKLQQIVIGEDGSIVYSRIYNGSTQTFGAWTPAT
jgi:hypothetical protein